MRKDKQQTIFRVPDYRLTTAEIIYRLPDHPKLLQQYIWQKIDVAPDFPGLKTFLNFWEREIEGALHTVRICGARLLSERELRHARASLSLH